MTAKEEPKIKMSRILKAMDKILTKEGLEISEQGGDIREDGSIGLHFYLKAIPEEEKEK